MPLLLTALMLFSCAPAKAPDPDTAYVFTDSAGHTVGINAPPARVAVLFSSHADIWATAGGEITITVGETVERGIVFDDNVTLVDEGAGKTIDGEALLAARPDFVIGSADVPAHKETAKLLREAGIPVALFRVECFADYLSMLKICTDITGRADLYKTHGTDLQAAIDNIVSTQPYAGKRILFVRASTTKLAAKGSADHFTAAMLTELGAVNIADEAPILLDGLSMETVLLEDPDYIFFSMMGSEAGVRAFIAQTLSTPMWQSLTAVQQGRYLILTKDLFHYKPNAKWQEAFEALAAFAAND